MGLRGLSPDRHHGDGLDTTKNQKIGSKMLSKFLILNQECRDPKWHSVGIIPLF